MPDIELLGAVYPNVPAVDLPKSPSGTARFYDVTGTTATAKDVLAGRYFYDENGVLTMGQLSLAPDVLFNGTGTKETVTLSASAANYDHMRIYFRHMDDDFYGSVDVYSPNGKTVQLTIAETTSWNGWLVGRAVVISGTSITTHNGNNYGEGKVNGDAEWSNTNNIGITRVEAWNDSTNFAKIYSSQNAPTSSDGVNGDIWMVTE